MQIKEMLTSNGRIPRSTYWTFVGCMFLFFALMSAAGQALPKSIEPVVGLLALPVIVLGIIFQVKRWHDLGKSGWWVLINLVPFVGGIITFINCGCMKGTEGPNRFGDDPLAPPSPLPSFSIK